jgi:hypothetical protein
MGLAAGTEGNVLRSRRRIHANVFSGARYLMVKLYVRGRYSLGLVPKAG